MVIHPNVVKSAKLSVQGLFGLDQLRRAAQKFCVCLCGPFCCQFANWEVEGGFKKGGVEVKICVNMSLFAV